MAVTLWYLRFTDARGNISGHCLADGIMSVI